MSKQMIGKSRTLIATLFALLALVALSLSGCGDTGTKSYTDVAAEQEASITTTKTGVIIDAATLKGWIDEGKLNAPFGALDRVVIVSPASSSEWTSKGHIAGAVRWGTDELAKSRIEGLALATNMMPDGAMMDGIIQRAGIDGNTTIVISLPKNSNLYVQSLLYWDLRYWGFPKTRLKILNGGDDAWEVAGYTLSTDTTEKYTASTYSVNSNGTLKDVVRGSIGETIAITDSLITTPALKNTWQIIDVRGATTTPYVTNALRYVAQGSDPAYAMYFTRLATGRNFVYPDKATLISRMATLTVKDGTTDTFASSSKKTLVMCAASSSASPTFALFDAVLDVAEGDIIMYDGSSSQWNNYSSERLLAAYPLASAAQRDAWSFNVLTNTRSQGAMATSQLYIWTAPSLVFGPTDTSMNQIETEDKAYMVPKTTSTSTTTTTGGGSPPSGC